MTTKNRVLNILKENQGSFFSGQDLADQLHVSRTAIWKAVESLRKEGIDIEAITKKGYRIKHSLEELDTSLIRNNLNPKIKKIELILLDSVDSTNTYIKKLSQNKEMANFTSVFAEEQTSGRGRTGKSFCSPRGTGIYMSTFLRTQELPKDISLDLLTIRSCVALYLALKDKTDKTLEIKWINDLYLDKKKIAGILTEGSLEQGKLNHIIIGIGLNVFTKKDLFSEDLQDKVDSLFPTEFNRSQLASQILNELYHVLYGMTDQEVLKIYRDNNLVLGKEVSFSLKDIQYTGLAKDVNEKGNLVVEVSQHDFILSSGQVSVKGEW